MQDRSPISLWPRACHGVEHQSVENKHNAAAVLTGDYPEIGMQRRDGALGGYVSLCMLVGGTAGKLSREGWCCTNTVWLRSWCRLFIYCNESISLVELSKRVYSIARTWKKIDTGLQADDHGNTYIQVERLYYTFRAWPLDPYTLSYLDSLAYTSNHNHTIPNTQTFAQPTPHSRVDIERLWL